MKCTSIKMMFMLSSQLPGEKLKNGEKYKEKYGQNMHKAFTFILWGMVFSLYQETSQNFKIRIKCISCKYKLMSQ